MLSLMMMKRTTSVLVLVAVAMMQMGEVRGQASCAQLSQIYAIRGFCPPPLIPTESSPRGIGTPEGCPCQLPCRSQMYDDDDYDNLDNFFLGMTIVSFVLISYTLASVCLTEKKRKKKMVLLFCMSSWLLNFALLVQSMDGGNDILCEDTITPHDQDDGGACLFTAIMIAYFALALSLWWFCNIVHLFLRVGALDDCLKSSTSRPSAVGGARDSKKYDLYWIYYSIISFGVPLISVIALSSAKVFGYYGPLPYCFTTDEKEWVTWTFFHGFLIALYCVGITMLVLSVLKICRALRGVTTTWRQSLQIHYVPLMFITIFSVFLLCVMSFRLLVAENKDIYQSNGEEWVGCLYANWVGNMTSGAFISDPATNCLASQALLTGSVPECGCGTHVPDGLPLSATYLISIALSGQGALIFLIFGLTRDHLKDWGNFFSRLFGLQLDDAGGSSAGMKSGVELSAA